MALFLEDSQKVTQKKITIPQNAKKVFKAMEKVYEPYLDKAEGGHVLKSLASDKHYNNKGNNADNNGEEKKIDTVSVDDAKVRLHRMDKFSPNSIQYQMFGGELAKNIYKDGIEKARSVSTVDAVKPPKPTSNAELKPAVVKTKEISTPNGKISYTVTAENKKPKKIYISENAVRKIYEDYRQLKLPFKNDSGKGYDYKENYELYIDFLESIGKYGKLGSYNGESPYQIISDLEANVYSKFIEAWGDVIEYACYAFNDMFCEANENNEIERYFRIPKEYLENCEYDISNELRLYRSKSLNEISKYLTDEGLKKFKKELYKRMSYYIDEINFEKDKRGLIYVEREISIPDIFNTQYSDAITPDNSDFFKMLSEKYKGVGVCWSFEKNNGEAYWAESFNGINSDFILLRGWVSPDSVDWESTMLQCLYMRNQETELRLKEGSIVEVDEAIIKISLKNHEFEGKNILNKPILVPA